MFEKLATKPSRGGAKATELTKLEQFLGIVADEGFRLSYSAFAKAAKLLGEDHSSPGAIPAQRGARLVQNMSRDLQPFVCRKDGGYARGVRWETEVPSDLRSWPVIDEDGIEEALQLAAEKRGQTRRSSGSRQRGRIGQETQA